MQAISWLPNQVLKSYICSSLVTLYMSSLEPDGNKLSKSLQCFNCSLQTKAFHLKKKMLTYLFTVIQSTKQNYTKPWHYFCTCTSITYFKPYLLNQIVPSFLPNNLKRRTFFLYNYCLGLMFWGRWTYSTRWSQMKNKTVQLLKGLKKKRLKNQWCTGMVITNRRKCTTDHLTDSPIRWTRSPIVCYLMIKVKCFLSNQLFNRQVIKNVLQRKTCHAKISKSGSFFDKLLYFDPKKIFHNTSLTNTTNAY